MSETATALPDWAHATLLTDGSIYFGGWQSIRDAIDAGYAALGRERLGDIPKWEWNLVGLAIAFHQHASIPTCSGCEKPITGIVIRCADCKTALHEGHCAEHHFWPNGRDTRNCLTIMEIRQRDEILKLTKQLEEARAAAIEECAQVAEADTSFQMLQDFGLQSTCAQVRENIAADIRALKDKNPREE